MAVIILYNTEFLNSTAQQMRQAAQSHADAIDKICNAVQELPDIWVGKAETEFMANFEKLAIAFKQFDQKLEGYARILENSAQTMEEADRAYQKKIESVC